MNESLTGYQRFLLSKIIDAYKGMAGAGDDWELAFRFLGEITDRETMAMGAGLSRLQITEYVNEQMDLEAAAA